MNYQELFRDEKLARGLIDRIQNFKISKPLKLMEVCGTHTMAIHQYGIKALLPEKLKLLSGPGCPVCVTPVEYLDQAIAYSRKPNFIIATFGDLFRVPGSNSNLRKEKARGAKVELVYSPLQALELAEKNPARQVVFLGVGFETTLPGIASTVKSAKVKGIGNFTVLLSARTIPKVLRELAKNPELSLSGFILPGHVSCIIGEKAYQFLAKELGVCGAVTGFEPLDILYAVLKLLELLKEKKIRILNLYSRAVKWEGNLKAQEIIAQVFEVSAVKWRGLGVMPETGLELRKEYEEFSALKRFPLKLPPARENPGCICGKVLSGSKTPLECALFAKTCTPENPVGACMVSTEGTCAAFYKYGG